MLSLKAFLLILINLCLLCVAIFSLEDWRRYLRVKATPPTDAGRLATRRRLSRQRNRLWLLVTVAWLVVFGLGSLLSGLPANANNWGDWAAGTFAPVAFLWLVLGYIQQGEELRDNVRALHMQEEALRLQVDELTKASRAQVDLVIATTQQTEAAIAAQRPWLGVKIDLEGDFDCTKDPATLRLVYGIFNGGHSPAHNVTIWCGFAPGSFDTRLSTLLDQSFQDARKSADMMKNENVGDVVFPGSTIGNPLTISISRAALTAAANEDGRVPFLQLAVCVRYRFARRGEGRTEKAFMIYSTGIYPSMNGIPVNGSRVPRSEMRIEQIPLLVKLE